MKKNGLLLAGVLLLALSPLLLNPHASFEGADGAAESAISQLRPDYQPWLASFWTPSPETESFLFALQAALGGGFIGYYIGRKKDRVN